MATDKKLNEAENHGNPRVIMWCIPRSVSTAMTKCLSFVDGAEVWMEPYVISTAAQEVFHRESGPFPMELAGNEEVYREAVNKLGLGGDVESYALDFLSSSFLKKRFDSIPQSTKFVIIKDMAFGMPPNKYPFLPSSSSGFRHFFLIRNPAKAYKSYREKIIQFILIAEPGTLPPSMTNIDPQRFHVINDVPPSTEGTPYFFEAINTLWHHIRKSREEDPVVLDIDDLLSNPATMLPRVFDALGIPYSDRYLTWDASDETILKWKNVCLNVKDAPRYAMWFANAFKSTCFKASSTTSSLEGVTNDVREVVEKEMPFYEEMYERRLTVR